MLTYVTPTDPEDEGALALVAVCPIHCVSKAIGIPASLERPPSQSSSGDVGCMAHVIVQPITGPSGLCMYGTQGWVQTGGFPLKILAWRLRKIHDFRADFSC